MTCPTCNGSGGLLIEISGRDWDDPDGIFDEETCPDCDGTGEVEDPDYDEEAEDLALVLRAGALPAKMVYLEERRAAELADPELAEAERQMQLAMQEEARQRVEEYRARQRQRSRGEDADDDIDDDEDDDFDVEVEYVP